MLAAVGPQGWPLWGKYRGCPVSDTASSHRPTTGHCWALQPGGDLGKTDLRRKRRCTPVRKITILWTPSSDKLERRGSRVWSRYFHVVHEKDHTRGGKNEGTAAHGEKPKIEQVYPEGLQPIEWTHAREGKRVRSRKKCEDKVVADGNSTSHSPPPCSVW